MNGNTVLKVAKIGFNLLMTSVVSAIATPMVMDYFKIDKDEVIKIKKGEKNVTPSVDVEEEEIDDDVDLSFIEV